MQDNRENSDTMATPELKFKLSIDGKEFTGVLDDAGQRVIRFGDGAASSAAKAGTSVQGLAGHLTTMGQAAAGAFAIGKLTAMTDAYASLNARVALASQGIGSAAVAQQRLFEIAEKSRVGVVGLSEVYSTLSKAASEMGVSQQRVLGITETLSKAMTLSGGSAESARAAMVQFGQGLSAGTLRGEELNSVLEQAPRLAQALAEGLGKPVGALKTMAEQGQITTEAIFTALERMKGKIDTEFEQLPTTVGQAMTVMQNSLLKTVGVFDQAGGVSRGFADGIMTVSKNMDAAVIGAAAVGTAYVLLRNSTVVATVATQGLALAQGALGGPIGLIATALGVAATAWVTWKATATQSEQTVQAQVAESDADIVKRIQGQIDKLRERNQLAGAPIPKGENQNSLDAAGRYKEAYAKWQALISGKDAVVGASEQTVAALLAARNERIGQAGKEVAAAFSLYDNLNTAMTVDAAAKTTASRDKFMESYASSGEKLAKQIADYDKEFAGKVTASQRAADIAAIKAAAPKTAAPKEDSALKAQDAYVKSLEKEFDTLRNGSAASKLHQAELLGIKGQKLESVKATIALMEAMKDGQKAAQAHADAHKKESDGIEAYMLAQTEGYAAAVKGSQDALAAAKDEYDQFGLTKSQIAAITLVRLEDQLVTKTAGSESFEAIQKQIEAQRELIGVMKGTEGLEATKKVNDEQVANWQKSVDQYDNIFREGFAGMVNGGKGAWKSFTTSLATTFKTSVADQIYKSFAQPFVVKFVASMLGVTGAAGAAADVGTSAAGGLASSALGSLTIAGSSIAAIGSSVMTGVSAGFAGTSLAPAIAAYTATGMTGVAGGLSVGSAIGAGLAAIGPVGWAALAVLAVAALVSGNGETRNGATYGVGSDGRATKLEGPSGGEIASKQAREMFDVTKASIEGMLTGLGSKAVLTGFQAALESSENGKGFAYATGKINGKDFGDIDTYMNNRGDKSPEQAIKDYQKELSQSILEALQVTEDIPATVAKLIKDGLNGAEVKDLTLEASNTILASVSKLSGEVSTFGAAMNLLPFANLKTLSFDAAAGLIASAGGFDKLVANLGGFYQNFYTPAEQTAQLTSNTAKAFAAIGQVMPALGDGTRAAYKAMVLKAEAELDGTDATAKAYASLLALQGPMNELAPAFAAVVESAAPAAVAVSDFAANMQKVTEGLQSTGASLQAQWDKLYLSEADYRTKQIAGMTDLQVAQFNTNATLQASIDAFATKATAASDALNVAKEVHATRTDADIRLLTAQGKTQEALTEQRKRDTAGMLPAQIEAYNYSKAIDGTIESLRAAAATAIALKEAKATLLAGVTSGASEAMAGVTRAVNAQKATDAAANEAQKVIATAAYTSQQEVMQASIDATTASLGTLSDGVGKLKSLSTALKSTLDGMRIAGSEAQYRAAAQAQLSVALQTARNGGGLPLDGQLDSALRTISQPSEALYGSFEAYARDFYATANDIAALAELTDTQLTEGQVAEGLMRDQLKAQQDSKSLLKDGFANQLSALDNILSTAQLQLDAANGINTSVLTIPQALAAFASALSGLQNVRTAQGLATTPGLVADATSAAGNKGISAYQAAADAVKPLDAAGVQGVIAEANARAVAQGISPERAMYNHATSNGLNAAMVDKYMGWANGTSNAWAASQSLPQFAQGINYVPGDMTARIHEGEAVIPKAFNPYNPNARTYGAGGEGNSNSNAELAAALRAMAARLDAIEANTRATAGHTAGTDRKLARVIPGNAVITQAATA